MTKEQQKEKIKNIYEDLIACNDAITNLCNQSSDQPDLRIGFELGNIHMIILRMFNDIAELRE